MLSCVAPPCAAACELTHCASSGFSGCCCQGDPAEWEAGGGRADPQSGPVLPPTALPAQQRPAEGAGGASGSLVRTVLRFTAVSSSVIIF